MLENFPFYVGLVVVIVLLILLAKRLQVAYPVLLVIGGLAISFIPGLPVLHIDPHLIFVIFLPPLLYEAAWSISWKELWRWRRIIGSFAFVVVFLTALSVALVANYYIPGFSLAMGFLLGGIVSPPDAVSAGAIMRFVKVPMRMASILEGESLLNDASSLIIFRFALIAVATGQFIWYQAALSFSWMVVGGIGVGLLVGWIFMKVHRFLHSDANTDIVLTIVTPYVMYTAAEVAHSSGVLAVVAGGLFLANNSHLFLSSTSRLRGFNFWENLTFVLNGLVFMFIGLDLPEIVNGLGSVSLSAAIGYGLLISAVLIVGRILAAYGAVIVTLIMRNFITVADARSPGLKAPLVIGWTGMRGVVSLAAALSIPADFPQRDLILFITFVVILCTLVVQGLTLPFIIRNMRLPDPDAVAPEEEVEALLRKQLADYALHHLEHKYGELLQSDPTLQQMAVKWTNSSAVSDGAMMTAAGKEAYRDILHHQRSWLRAKNRHEKLLNEELIRKYLRYLDLEEEKLEFV
ncbi:Na+/H+ antiporter [Dinghuibacter silviterrae]|uniref:Na+/H+ antiporter n=1 Tax=Dinghuibacter silviterrae TaxID=1539049 RepID=UPI0010626BEA|nr:Na+/H+ antiporter [Dinghuibacter silviterrae]